MQPVNSLDSSEYIYQGGRYMQTNSQAPPQQQQQPQQYTTNATTNMDYQNNYERVSPQRRVLRQSTLPSTLPNPDQYYQNNVNLMPPPISPNPASTSPQYSPYNTDTEEMMDSSATDLRSTRYPIRRQSTMPCRPSDAHQQKYLSSTSPNRNYSRSPEKNAETELYRYPPPFVRQSTFPSIAASANADQFNMHRPKILPTSPNRMGGYNKSPEHCSEPDFQKRHAAGIMRQSTLPNPDQHMKLLPTSPPKQRQLSPQYKKRSPEMLRQNTMPNPDGMNSLNIPQTTKFLPISPRMKQNFLFPQPSQNPRQFLSQQNVPTIADESNPYSSTGSVSCLQREHQIKMMKVRSHSNEEYSASRVPHHVPEGRRLLPEIPRNRSRSPR